MTPAITFKLTDQTLAVMAAQVVVEAAPLKQICEEAGITEQYYHEVVEKNPFYLRLRENYAMEWGSITKTEERIKWRSRIMMELALPTLGVRMMNQHEDLTKVTEAAKLIAKLGGVDSTEKGPGVGEKFTITINLGPDEVTTYEKPATVVVEGTEAVPIGTAGPTALLPEPDEEGDAEAVRGEPEG